MEQCNNIGCIRPAEVVSVQDAAFCMTSSSTQSKRAVKICTPCSEREIRMEQYGKPAALGKL